MKKKVFVAFGVAILNINAICCDEKAGTLVDNSLSVSKESFDKGREASNSDINKNKKIDISPEGMKNYIEAIKLLNVVKYASEYLGSVFPGKENLIVRVKRLVSAPKEIKQRDLDALKEEIELAFANIDPNQSDGVRKEILALNDVVSREKAPIFYDAFEKIFKIVADSLKTEDEMNKFFQTIAEGFDEVFKVLTPNKINDFSTGMNEVFTKIISQLESSNSVNAIYQSGSSAALMSKALDLLKAVGTVNAGMDNIHEVGEKLTEGVAEILAEIQKNTKSLKEAKDKANVVVDKDILGSYIGNEDEDKPIIINGAAGGELVIYDQGNKKATIELEKLEKLTVLTKTESYKENLKKLFKLMDKADGCTAEDFIKEVRNGQMLNAYKDVMYPKADDNGRPKIYGANAEELKKNVALLSTDETDPKYLVMVSGEEPIYGRDLNVSLWHDAMYSFSESDYQSKDRDGEEKKYYSENLRENRIQADLENWFAVNTKNNSGQTYEGSIYYRDLYDVVFDKDIVDSNPNGDYDAFEVDGSGNLTDKKLDDWITCKKSGTCKDGWEVEVKSYTSTSYTKKVKFVKNTSKTGYYSKKSDFNDNFYTRRNKSCDFRNSVVIKRGDGKKIKINGHELDQVTVVRNDGRSYIKELEGLDVKKVSAAATNFKIKEKADKVLKDKLTSLQTSMNHREKINKRFYDSTTGKWEDEWAFETFYKLVGDNKAKTDNLTYRDLFEMLDALNKDFMDAMYQFFVKYYYRKNYSSNNTYSVYSFEDSFSKRMDKMSGNYNKNPETNDEDDFFGSIPTADETKILSPYNFKLSNMTFQYLYVNEISASSNPIETFKNRSEADKLKYSDAATRATWNYTNHLKDVYDTTLNYNLARAKEIEQRCDKYLEDKIKAVEITGGCDTKYIDNVKNDLVKTGVWALDPYNRSQAKDIKLLQEDLANDINTMKQYENKPGGTIEKEMKEREDAWNKFYSDHLDINTKGTNFHLRTMVNEANADIETLYKQYLDIRKILLDDTGHTLETDYSQMMANLLGNTRMTNLLNNTGGTAYTVQHSTSTHPGGGCCLYTEQDIEDKNNKCKEWIKTHKDNLPALWNILQPNIKQYETYKAAIDQKVIDYSGTDASKSIEGKLNEAKKKFDDRKKASDAVLKAEQAVAKAQSAVTTAQQAVKSEKEEKKKTTLQTKLNTANGELTKAQNAANKAKAASDVAKNSKTATEIEQKATEAYNEAQTAETAATAAINAINAIK